MDDRRHNGFCDEGEIRHAVQGAVERKAHSGDQAVVHDHGRRSRSPQTRQRPHTFH